MALFIDVIENEEPIVINFDAVEVIRGYGSDNKAEIWFKKRFETDSPDSIKTDMPYLDLVRQVQRKQCKVDVMEPLLCHTVKFDSSGNPID